MASIKIYLKIIQQQILHLSIILHSVSKTKLYQQVQIQTLHLSKVIQAIQGFSEYWAKCGLLKAEYDQSEVWGERERQYCNSSQHLL